MHPYLPASPSFDIIPAVPTTASAGTSALRVQNDAIRSCRILILAGPECISTAKNELTSAGYDQLSATSDPAEFSVTLGERETDLILVEASKLALEAVQEALAAGGPENRLPMLAMAERDDKVCRQLAVEVGVSDFIQLPVDGFELTTRVGSLLQNRLAAEKLARYSSLLETDILIDPTTNIANRRAFDFELSRKMIEWQRQRTPVALVMLDIDYFKRVNDQHGHPAGDKVLAQTARSIEASLRQMDLVCRFGGEEFAIILPIKRPHESTQTAERIRQKIEAEVFRFEQKELKLTVSIGVAEAMKGDDQQLIVKRADTALYESKQRGRNCVTFHNGARCVPIRKATDAGSDDQKLISQESLWSWAVHDDVFNVSVDDLDRGRFRADYETGPPLS